MSERATVFGVDAEAYHRFRPGYPDEIVDLVVSHADGRVTRALEVGAGTGKASVVFAARGIEVIAVEPDRRMSSVLGAAAGGLPIRIVDSSFEGLDLAAIGRVDLLFAAAAFHWTDPATRWMRAARVVRPGGVTAFFGVTTEIADATLSERINEISQSVLGVDSFDVGAIAGGEQDADADADHWPATDLRQCPEFTDVIETTMPAKAMLTAEHFVSHLSTVSAYRVLAEPDRTALLARIRAALPEIVEVSQDVTIHLARRI